MATIENAHGKVISAIALSEMIRAYEAKLDLHEQTLIDIENYAVFLGSKNTVISTKTVAEKLHQILEDHNYGTS